MKALEGIKVVDLTHALAGPLCTYHLQLLGADVVKIERPGIGDDFRAFARRPGWSVSPSFISVNAGKRSMTLDFKTSEGQEVTRRLATRADVVVENQRPGALAGLGLDWPALSKLNPRLVMCSLSGFGQKGAMSRWPAYDHTIAAMTGMMWRGGDDIPEYGRGFSVDCFSGYVAYAAIVVALLRRERFGMGQYLDVAMLDASMVLMAVGIVRQLLLGDDMPAFQAVVHDRPTVAPYRTADRWIFLSGNFQNHYESLCRVLGAPELLTDPRFVDVRTRNEHSAELKAELAKRIAGRSAIELERELMEAGCPAAVVRTTDETVRSPYMRERGMLLETTVPDRDDRVTLVNAGFMADADGPGLRGPVPALGAHTDEILGELGYSASDIAGMRERGIV